MQKYLEINSTKKLQGLNDKTNNNTAWKHVKTT